MKQILIIINFLVVLNVKVFAADTLARPTPEERAAFPRLSGALCLIAQSFCLAVPHPK